MTSRWHLVARRINGVADSDIRVGRWALRWSTLRTLGESRAVRHAYLWFALIPIAAHILSDLNQILRQFELSSLTLELPFRWQLLFGSACGFSVGSLLYVVFCPEFVREFRRPSDLRSAEGQLRLSESLVTAIERRVGRSGTLSARERSWVTQVVKWSAPDLLGELGRTALKVEDVRRLLLHEENRLCGTDEGFWLVREIEDSAYPWALWSAASAYAMGLVLLALVSAEHVFAVVHGG